MNFSVIKTFAEMPCAHTQDADILPDGSPGPCASLHGYARTVTMTVTGQLCEYGWVIPFGAFKDIRKFLEYYFDHTSLFSASDHRQEAIQQATLSGITGTSRILPYGVSMEMSGLFVWEQVNPYILQQTDGRAWLEKIEMREHSKNAGSIQFTESECRRQYARTVNTGTSIMTMQPVWDEVAPSRAVNIHI